MKFIINNQIGYKGMFNSTRFYNAKHDEEIVPDLNWFYVENITQNNEVLSIRKDSSSAPTLSIEYSTDKINWNTFGNTSTTALTMTLQPSDKIYLRCSTTGWGDSGASSRNVITGVSRVGGNIMSLLYGSNFTGTETSLPLRRNAVFYRIFSYGVNSVLIDASELVLPATSFTGTYAYYQMFLDCTSLTAAPQVLPATTMYGYCYCEMFMGCESLTSVPTTLGSYISGYGCCWSMFEGCTALTKAPELPAATLNGNCYQRMFYGCSNLAQVKCLATSGINEDNSTTSWLSGVKSNGIFTKAQAATWPTGVSGIPSGWTIINDTI